MQYFDPRKPLQPDEEKVPGGLILALPPSLESVGQQLAEMQRIGRPHETAEARIALLQATLARLQAQDNDYLNYLPETLATLQYELAIAHQDYLHADRAQQIEAALAACQAALQVYTLAHYPYQYAHIQITLGNVYRERLMETQRNNLEQAISCYREALGICTLADFPYEYAKAQYGLGQTYQIRIEGDRQDNLEQAIAFCHEALRLHTRERFPFEHAQALHALGTAYFRRIAGEQRDNLEQAINCYRQAADIFTVDDFPLEYAQGRNYLAIAYSQRISGEQRDNLEQAINYYRQALGVYTLEAFSIEYAMVQTNLGITYRLRIAGERRDNLEQAIAACREGLRVSTLVAFPFRYGMLQNNLGAVYLVRITGERRDNLEQAIACYREGLRAWTLDAFPHQYGKIQNNLGEAYQHRLAGERRDNLEQAIACYQEALRILTLEALPQDYALVQRNLGVTYQERMVGERQENLNLALTAHRESLRVYTLHAFPNEHRQVQMDCAETQVLREDWAAAHDAYTSAHKAEDLLVALGAGAIGRDAVLKEGRDASVRDAFVLTRLGKVEEAAVTIERGRARGLAEAMQFNTADPNRISNAERRARYLLTHQTLIAAQASLQDPLPKNLDEDGQRQIMLERTAIYRTAKTVFDAVIEEVRAAEDPADFFADTLDAATILEAAKHCGLNHALVYLAATPWGGMAMAAFTAQPNKQTPSHLAALALPALTDAFVNTLMETSLDDETGHSTGGFDCAQRGTAFELLQHWPGGTLREHAEALHEACSRGKHEQEGTLDTAAHFILSIPQLASLVDAPLTTLDDGSRSLLMSTLNHAVLERELQRCQSLLSDVVLQPLLIWLQEAAVSNLTLIPCGPLAALPLAGILMSDGRTLGETLPTSLAPSARSLLRHELSGTPRTGIYAVGNPYPTRQELRWGEAEAFTMAALGKQLAQPAGVKVQWQATRDWLIEILQTGYIVDVSCHGCFDTHDFLRSRLLLAHEEELSLADMLSHQTDLRGLRLLILSACRTALLDLQGARDEVRSLAAGMLQAGAAAVLAALWAVDDQSTYLLMVRFAWEWFPRMHDEPPAAALARTQRWLRTVTNRELQAWQIRFPLPPTSISAHEQAQQSGTPEERHLRVNDGQLVAVRGRANRFDAAQAQENVQAKAEEQDLDACPYADPYYWAGFQITGW